jgi:hypothetical protein
MATDNTTTTCGGDESFAAAASPPAGLTPVLVVCDGGVVRDVLNLQPGQEYEILEADVLEDGGDDAADYWDDLSEAARTVALDRYKDWAAEATQLSEARKTGPDYQKRWKRMREILEDEPAIGNGYELDDKPLRFLGVEFHGGSIVWAYTAGTLEQLRTIIDSSETERDRVRMVDLDTGEQYAAVFKVSGQYPVSVPCM